MQFESEFFSGSQRAYLKPPLYLKHRVLQMDQARRVVFGRLRLIVGGGNDCQLNGLLFSLFYLYALPTAFVRFEEVRFMVVVFQIFERQHRVVTRIQPMDRKVPTLVSTIFLVEITTLAASSFELGSYSSRILWGAGL
jgi:hypothetical protein